MTEPYWMKHFGATGPRTDDEQNIVRQLEALDREQERVTTARSALYKRLRAGRKVATPLPSDLAP